MMMKPLFVLLIFSQLIISCSLTNELTEEKPLQTEAYHHLTIQIDPAASFLDARDVFSYNLPFTEKTLILLNSLEIYEMNHSSGQYEYLVEDDGENYQRITIINQSDKETELPEFTFSYRGRVYDPPSQTTMTQTHSRTTGIISPNEDEGLYLPPNAFYPVSTEEMSMFDLYVTVPGDYTIVASGKKMKHMEGDKMVFHYKTDFPIHGMTLTGGPFIKESKMYDGVEFALYTYAPNRHQEQFLDASITYYKQYTALFGPYPFDSFRIVENFFDTGFGMPGYTLLSGALLQMPWVTLSPGSLAHEFVHNWWGNSVFVDYDQGNWCEALTTFSTNYYYNELTDNEQGALDWRKSALISVSDLPAEKMYPVSAFVTQRDTYDAVIGYQKGAFAFYELYKFMGKEAFFAALKDFAMQHKGRKASWDDLLEAYRQHAGSSEHPFDYNELIHQLFYSNDIPHVSLGEVLFNETTMQLSFDILQDKDLHLLLPVAYSKGESKAVVEVLIDDSRKRMRVETAFVPNEIRIDPQYQSLRQLEGWEKPYNLYRTLNADPIVVMPDPGSADFSAAEEINKMLKASGYDFRVKQAGDITDELLRNNSVIVLGNPRSNALFEKVTEAVFGVLAFEANGLFYDEKFFEADRHLLLFNGDHPVNREQFCTIIYFQDLADASAFRRLFHYQRVSMVLLNLEQTGRPAAQQEIMPGSGPEESHTRRL
jgi:aminopeptidase N